MAEIEEIFSTPDSEARLDLIKHLIENSELVPLVRGMSGIGKSLMASRLQAGAPKNWMICHFSADSMMQPERLLAHIARCNGLPDAKDDNIRRLVERFETLRGRGVIPVLLIDDAQELPPTSLITLLRLYERQIDGLPLVSLVLFANEQIDMLLTTPQLQVMSPQSIQVIDLPPLTRNEADAYMHYLLNAEGLDQQLALEASRMDRLYRETKGAPGPLANEILRAVGESDGLVEQDSGRFRKSWLWGLVPLGAIVLLLLLFQGPVNRMFSPEVPVSGEKREEVAREEPAEVPQTEQAGAQPVEGGIAIAMTEKAPLESEPLSEPLTPSEAPMAMTPLLDGETGSEPVGTQAEAASIQSEKGTVEDRVSPMPPVEDEPPISEGGEKSADETIGAMQTAEEEAGAPDTVEVEPSKPVEVTPAVEEKVIPAQGEALVKSADWLKEQTPGSYTIQLLAVENIESLQPVIDKYQLQGEIFSVRTVRQGRPWYHLLWGRYPNRSAAKEAVKSLAPELRKGGAWARPISSLRP